MKFNDPYDVSVPLGGRIAAIAEKDLSILTMPAQELFSNPLLKWRDLEPTLYDMINAQMRAIQATRRNT